jgi:sugar transferase EpsL
MTPLGHLIKRAADLGIATAGFVTLSPALAAIAALIKLDSHGPVLFRQKRLGLHARSFDILKFRTMHSGSGVHIGADGLVINHPDDARHTRVGRILRQYSLDEVPQLLNVVRGEMSLVGPRPDLPEALSFYTPEQRTKLQVKPGMTGLAQVRGRNTLTPQDRWALDVAYVRSSSLMLDLQILAHTFSLVFSAVGVYQKRSP